MLPSEKKIRAMIKKFQKKTEAKKALVENNKPTKVVEEVESSEIFSEMKKLPFTE
jgi:hypothetical protein